MLKWKLLLIVFLTYMRGRKPVDLLSVGGRDANSTMIVCSDRKRYSCPTHQRAHKVPKVVSCVLMSVSGRFEAPQVYLDFCFQTPCWQYCGGYNAYWAKLFCSCVGRKHVLSFSSNVVRHKTMILVTLHVGLPVFWAISCYKHNLNWNVDVRRFFPCIFLFSMLYSMTKISFYISLRDTFILSDVQLIK